MDLDCQCSVRWSLRVVMEANIIQWQLLLAEHGIAGTEDVPPPAPPADRDLLPPVLQGNQDMLLLSPSATVACAGKGALEAAAAWWAFHHHRHQLWQPQPMGRCSHIIRSLPVPSRHKYDGLMSSLTKCSVNDRTWWRQPFTQWEKKTPRGWRRKMPCYEDGFSGIRAEGLRDSCWICPWSAPGWAAAASVQLPVSFACSCRRSHCHLQLGQPWFGHVGHVQPSWAVKLWRNVKGKPNVSCKLYFQVCYIFVA